MKKFSTIALSLMLWLSPALGGSSPAASGAPYPASKVITKLTWDSDVVIMEGCISGDNWPIAWVNDDLQITAFCDGKGFSKQAPDLSQGFARVFGNPPEFHAENFKSDADTPMPSSAQQKPHRPARSRPPQRDSTMLPAASPSRNAARIMLKAYVELPMICARTRVHATS